MAESLSFSFLFKKGALSFFSRSWIACFPSFAFSCASFTGEKAGVSPVGLCGLFLPVVSLYGKCTKISLKEHCKTRVLPSFLSLGTIACGSFLMLVAILMQKERRPPWQKCPPLSHASVSVSCESKPYKTVPTSSPSTVRCKATFLENMQACR